MVGFTGSRSLSAQSQPLVAQVVAAVSQRGIAVGCAAGLDKIVRSACPAAMVFSVKQQPQNIPYPARLARRSVAMVAHVAATSQPLIIGFPVGPCPAGLVPSPSSSACFSGKGSGTWASLAYAVGLGLPVVVFGCSSLPAWGQWSAALGQLGQLGGVQLGPAQAGLF